MNKRGQVAIFVIIAIVIVAAILIYFFVFRGRISPGQEIPSAEIAPITNGINNCVQTLLKDGTRLAALQGGYIIPPDNSLETNFSYISYGYYLGKNVLASKTKIESEISSYIEINIPFCLDLHSLLPLIVVTGQAKAVTKISDDKITSSVSFPLTITKGTNTMQVSQKYSPEYSAELGRMYNAAQGIIAKEIQNPDVLDMSYISSFDYDVSLLHQDNDIIVYSIKKYDNETGGIVFRFANKLR